MDLKTFNSLRSRFRAVFIALFVFSFVNVSQAKEPSASYSFSLQKKSFNELMEKIEENTDYRFVYDASNVNLNFEVDNSKFHGTISEILNNALKRHSVAYELRKKNILLFPSQQENYELKGRVSDFTTGESLPGVNVFIPGVSGTSTDFDGNYSIQVSGNEQLSFSYIGYKTKTVSIDGRKVIDVALEVDAKAIDEVVVIGYGTSSKKLLTTSVSSINSKAINELPTPTIDGVIQGQATGVNVVQNSGTPGGGMSVRIRGNSSITAGSDPLYVVDGIPIISGDNSMVGMSGQGLNSLSDLNPNDIESISILKDASAASIYGARASNGVVLITTKRGKSEKTTFNVNAFYGIQQLANKLEVLDASDYMRYINDRSANDGTRPPYGEDEINNPAVNTDWLDAVFRTAETSNFELSMSGGNAKTKFYTSGTVFNQEGILIGTDYRRLSARANVDHQIDEKNKIALSYGISWSHNNRVEGDQTLNGPLPNAMTMPSIFPVFNEDGTYNEDGPYANPVAIGQNAINWARSFRNMANVSYDYKITSKITFTTKFGLDSQNLNEHSYDPITTRQGNKYNGLGIEANASMLNWVNNTSLNYSNTFNESHDLSILLGTSFESFERRSHYTEAVDFPNENFEYIESAATIRAASTNMYQERLQSVFTRVSYNYEDKYLLTANTRVDGSSKFGKNNRYGIFPSGSLAWRVAQEEFFSSKVINDLKLRLGIGLTGNDGIPNFRSLGLYGGGYNYNGKPGISPLQIANPDLRWEKTLQYNAGFDLGIFEDKFTFNFDYYYKLTSDLLLNRPLPLSSGFGSQTANIGSMSNWGLELGINWNIISSENVQWSLTWNNSLNRNEVLKLYQDQPILDIGRGGNAVIVGETVAAFYGYSALGVDASTGNIIFEDLNGDRKITSEDRKVIGNPMPIFSGGLTNNLRIGGFSLSMFFQYSYGNDVFNGSNLYMEAMKGKDNQTVRVNDRWMNVGDNTYMPKATNKDPNDNNRISSRFIEDGSYIRLKNLNLSYTFKSWEKAGITNPRIYFTGQNLLTFTNYSGMDPEVNYAGNDPLAMGTDFFTYPQSRMYSLGINFGF